MKAQIKERRTRILLTLFLLGKDKSHTVFSDRNKKIFSLPADSPRSRGTMRQMIHDGVIEKEEAGVYLITEKGLLELSLSFPLVRFMLFPWDGKFRILSYEIPEKKRSLRDSLRREVSGWGLGPWHRSFWITPHPIIPELKNLMSKTELNEYVQAFEGVQSVGEEKVLIEKVWELSKLEVVYKKTFKNWHTVLSEEKTSKENKMQEVVNAFLEVLKMDPGLPPELVGKQWIGFEAFEIFQEMKKILLTT